MIRRLLAVAATVLITGGWYGCSDDDDNVNAANRIVDCEVCVDMGEEVGGKTCFIERDVSKKDCEECRNIDGIADAEALGVTVICSVK